MSQYFTCKLVQINEIIADDGFRMQHKRRKWRDDYGTHSPEVEI